MATIISGDTGIDKITDGSVVAADIGAGEVTQAKLASGVAGTGPAFSAYRSSDQSGVSANTWTKVQVNAEDWDTTSDFDSTTNYRFTPSVAGYYQVNAHIGFYQPSTQGLCAIYKNGSIHKWGIYITRPSGSTADIDSSVNALVYMNGTTDYIELYGYQDGASPKFYGTSAYAGRSYFSAHLARAA